MSASCTDFVVTRHLFIKGFSKQKSNSIQLQQFPTSFYSHSRSELAEIDPQTPTNSCNISQMELTKAFLASCVCICSSDEDSIVYRSPCGV